MEASVLDYDLPPELIAQHPAARRDSSRLLVYDRARGDVRHRVFADLPDELSGELAVVNDTRVVPARIRIERPKGEVLLLEHEGGGEWLALARPTRRLRAGSRYGAVELIEHLGDGRWRVRLDGEPQGPAGGTVPLPPYITEPLADPSRYQTVYAEESGSAAAPTAGLHFTPELLGRLDVERVTLHVGLDTFRPLTAPTLEEHELHGERYSVRPEAWERIQAAERVLAVGTTTVRVLETVARDERLTGPNDALRHARLRVPPRGCAADELPPAALDPAGARDGLRGHRGDAAAVPARDRGALSLLLVRRRHADRLKPLGERPVGELEEARFDDSARGDEPLRDADEVAVRKVVVLRARVTAQASGVLRSGSRRAQPGRRLARAAGRRAPASRPRRRGGAVSLPAIRRRRRVNWGPRTWSTRSSLPRSAERMITSCASGSKVSGRGVRGDSPRAIEATAASSGSTSVEAPRRASTAASSSFPRSTACWYGVRSGTSPRQVSPPGTVDVGAV